MPRPSFCLLAALTCALWASPAEAGKVATWRHDARDDFATGQLDGLVLGSSGELTLSRETSLVADLECGSVWDLVRTPQGKIFAATALPGQVVEVTPQGKQPPLWKHDSLQAFSLATLPDGSLLVGTGPQGTIYKIGPDGKASEFFRADAAAALYIWDLVVDAQGTVFAATGPGGKIYKIDSSGETHRLFYDTQQPHVLALAPAADGKLIAGTSGAGLVLGIDATGNGRVLYEAAEKEVHTLLTVKDGVIYAGTAAGDTATAQTTTEGSAAPAKNPAGKADANSVYRIGPGGDVRKVLGLPGLVYALAPANAGAAGELLVGTGKEGLLYETDPNGRGDRQLARFDAELLLSMLGAPDGKLLIGTGNPGKLFSVSAGHRPSGTLTSAALDAKLVARFGALVWRADAPGGTQVSVAVRSGNTNVPDEMWSPWSVEQTDPAQARATCPAGRFLQYRVTLRTNDPAATPRLQAVSVRYQTANQAPQIAKLTVPHVEEGDGKQPLDKLKLSWTASDPNGDDLLYSLAFKKPQWKSWVTLKENLTTTDYEWDTTGVPEGVYVVRLTATDRSSTTQAEALETTVGSEPFIVDRTAPTVQASLVGTHDASSATIQADLRDALTPIAAASYSLDSGPWVNVFPSDELFDSPSEQVRWQVKDLAPGTHVLVIRATDAAGHTGSADVVFEITKDVAAD